MRGFGVWTVAGLAVWLGMVAAPASALGSAAPAEVTAGEPPAARWVVAARVRLRGGPSDDAAVLGGFAVNTPVRVTGRVGDWCDVDGGADRRGWVACRLLGDAPLDVEAITRPWLAGGGNPDYDPARAFALEPTWHTLEQYAWHLDERRRAVGDGGRPTPDPILDHMKAELAKGAYGEAPAARADVAKLLAFADAAIATGEPPVRREAAVDIGGALHLWGGPFDDGERALGALAAIDLPAVRPSYFARHDALAAGDDAPDALSGRFGIVHRWVTTPVRAHDDAIGPLYDIGSAKHLLVRPVRRVRLFADGTLVSADSHAVAVRDLQDEHGCGGWVPGFQLGELAATDPAWAAFGDWSPDAHAEAGQPAGALYAFYVPTALPQARASVGVVERTLDPETTGFARATTRVFDVDHDAVPDLLIWEAAGFGPGHMDGPTETVDTWYRLVLANVAGRWVVLGTDEFSYGCGC